MDPILFGKVNKPASRRISQFIKNLPSLTVYYPLNEASGNAINQANSTKGTFNGTVSGATQGVAGKSGKAYSFDGNADRVIVTGLVVQPTFSFCMLFKRVGTPDANDRILDQASGGPTRGWHVGLDANGNAGLRTWNNGGAQLSLDYGIVPDGEWVILSGSIGLTQSKIFLNGTLVATGAANSFGSGVIADLQLGCRSGGTSNALTGLIQHVAIANNVEWSDSIHHNLSVFFLI